MTMPDDDVPEVASFTIEGPDEDGCVWIYSAGGPHVWGQNLGPPDKVAEVLSEWLGSIDYQESGGL